MFAMNEQDVRALVRETIARHLAGTPSPFQPLPTGFVRQHASHALLTVASGADIDGPCIIEPAVTCTHCGYCKSYGH